MLLTWELCKYDASYEGFGDPDSPRPSLRVLGVFLDLVLGVAAGLSPTSGVVWLHHRSTLRCFR